MAIIEDQTDYVLQNKIISKEAVIESLSKRADQLVKDLDDAYQQLFEAGKELANLIPANEIDSSDQETVTQNAFLHQVTPKPAQPESHEDGE